jgi:hypothetical protein
MKALKILGKTVPVWLVAALAMAGVVSATSIGLLTFYGQIVSTQTVNQAIRLDGMICLDTVGTGCTESPSYSDVEGTTILDSPHVVKNFASVAASGQINSVSSCGGVTPVVTSTITESSSAADYSLAVNSLVSFDVSGKTLADVLAQPLQYTDDVSNPLYAPNINIFLSNGDVIQAWGKDWSGSGLHTVTFAQLVEGPAGYGATVNPGVGVWPAIVGANAEDGSGDYFHVAKLLLDYGSVSVVKIEVRAQAGAAGGQIDTITQFIGNGLTAVIPDMVNLNGQTFTLLPSESFSFGVSTTYPINMLQGTCTVTTQVVPA